jgi:hypothetical protein
MDESGKATTAEALVPIIAGKNLIFVGDHRQLRPMLTTTREVESWLRGKFKKEADELESWEDYFNRPSLFEQVIKEIDFDFKAQLTECRRSSKDQVLLTSECFYEPEGDEAIEPVDREQNKEHNLPLGIDSSILFIDMGSDYKHKTDDRSKSSYNEGSAVIIPEILELLNHCDTVKDYSFGVITGYTAQYRKLKKNIDKKRFQGKLDNVCKWNKEKYEDKLTVSVVDRFQGLERDIVIVDLVKSGAGCNLGFLETPNRINVALSRQKRLLIIVGDYHSIINAKTRRCKGGKAALQLYLEKIKPDWVVKAEQIKELFPFKETEEFVIAEKQPKIEERSIDIEKIKKAATKTWNPEIQKIELNTYFNALVQEVKNFSLKRYGYSTFKDLCIDYGFNMENSEDGKIYIIPTFDFEKPTKLKQKKILPIPFEKALEAFHKCKANENGLVNTKDYFKQLQKEIKRFNPLDYGGRFNEFYKNMGVFDIIVEDKDTKFLKLKG